ncbi:ankyrin repeat and BTB/POZ domain-containing protein [Acrasis kona]|uniref:Ankyrin repeat and BTB/POZ domain-containing protein n=1 Tax=Acrasis kona TaxID=1008807 RepID=A0AAW2ZCM5_9EUKA
MTDVFQEFATGTLSQVMTIFEEHYHFLNEENKYGRTPLYIAAHAGREDIVKYLLSIGATDDENHTAYTSALTNKCRDLLRPEKNSKKAVRKVTKKNYKHVFQNLTQFCKISKKEAEDRDNDQTPSMGGFIYFVVSTVDGKEITTHQEYYKIHLNVILCRLGSLTTKTCEALEWLTSNLNNLTNHKNVPYDLVDCLINYLYTGSLKYQTNNCNLLELVSSNSPKMPHHIQALLGLAKVCEELHLDVLSGLVLKQLSILNKIKDKQDVVPGHQIDEQVELCSKHLSILCNLNPEIVTGDPVIDYMSTTVDIKLSSTESTEEYLYCHQDILVYSSDYFKVALTGQFAEAQEIVNRGLAMYSLQVENCSFEMLSSLVGYLYTGTCLVTDTNAVGLIFLYNFLDLPIGLKRKCEEYILNNIARFDNLYDVLHIAYSCHNNILWWRTIKQLSYQVPGNMKYFYKLRYVPWIEWPHHIEDIKERIRTGEWRGHELTYLDSAPIVH